LNISWQVLEDLSNLINETSAQHFVSLIENYNLKEIGSQSFFLNQIFYSSGCSNNYLNTTILKSLTILSWISSSNTATCIDFQELTETENNFIDLLGKFPSGSKDDGLAFGRLRINSLEQTN
jgi:hypothetical protein